MIASLQSLAKDTNFHSNVLEQGVQLASASSAEVHNICEQCTETENRMRSLLQAQNCLLGFALVRLSNYRDALMPLPPEYHKTTKCDQWNHLLTRLIQDPTPDVLNRAWSLSFYLLYLPIFKKLTSPYA